MRGSTTTCLIIAGVMTGAGHPAARAARPVVTAFVEVSVVEVGTGSLIARQTVIVEGERIIWVGPSDQAAIPAGATRIDGMNQFLAPGLADMHVHADPEALGLYLANGVTTIRDLNGDTTRLRLRDEIASGTREGPTMIVSGPLLAGERQRWRHRFIASAEEGREEVIREGSLGFNLVKIYDGLSQEAYLAIVSVADSLGLPVTGHIPRAVGLQHALDQQQNIEHAASIIDATIGHAPDTMALDSALDAVAAAGVWLTPTLAAFEALTLTGSPAVWARFEGPELQYVDRDTRDWWRSLRRGTEAPGISPRAQTRWNMLHRVVSGLARRGAPLLAGTDDPNPLMVPGFALHEELRVLQSTGLSRREVLAMATLAPARFLGTAGEFGVVRAGARADLVLLTRNPLEDLAILRQPVGVMARGRWYSKARLKEMLADVAQKYQ